MSADDAREPVSPAGSADEPSAGPRDEPRPPREPRTPRDSRSRASRRGSGEASPPKPRATSNRARIRAGLIETYVGIGGGLSMAGMIRSDVGFIGSGQAVVENAESAADAWLTLADQNPAVMRALSTFVEGSAVAAVIIAHAPMVMPLLQSRGVFGEAMQQAQAAAATAGFAQANGTGGVPFTPQGSDAA